MKRILRKITGRLLLSCLLILPFSRLAAADLTVFAAASLTDAMRAIGADYEKRSHDKVVFNFGASSLLARQIQEGAPADVFFSADEAKMDGLEKKGLILKETRRSLLSNALVIVVASEQGVEIEKPDDLASDRIERIALAETRTVPAGIYAREFLERRSLWHSVEPKVVPTQNVRGALAAVESGNVDAGIVYKTDAAISRNVRIACEVPREDGPAISYPVAVVAESSRVAAAKAFLEYLASDDAAEVFEKFGFIVLKDKNR